MPDYIQPIYTVVITEVNAMCKVSLGLFPMHTTTTENVKKNWTSILLASFRMHSLWSLHLLFFSACIRRVGSFFEYIFF